MLIDLILKNVNKSYGKKHTLNNVSLSLPQSTIALLGPNGAGKTTLLKIISTIAKQDSGQISFGDLDWNHPQNVKQILGYLPQDFTFYPYLTVYECLKYIALLKNMEKSQVDQCVARIVNQTNLADACKKKVKDLSGGMLRRLGIAQALLNNPQILLVDEPTAGLDPEERTRFRNLVVSETKGRTVIISTHLAEDVEKMCKYVAVIIKGAICFWGTITDFVATADGYVMDEAMDEREAQNIRKKHHVINDWPGINDTTRIRYLMQCKNENAARPTVEDAYLQLVRQKENSI